MNRSHSSGAARLAGALALGLLAACSDGPAPTQTATPPTDGPDLVVAGGGEVAAALITCTFTRSPATVVCTSPQGTTVGGKGNHARLIPTSPTYGSGVFSVNVAVQNLLVQKMGTPDGTTVTGINVYFPKTNCTINPGGGTGTVTVTNHTGLANFSSAGQKYFAYNTILGMQATSASLPWQISAPNTANSWRCEAYVSTDLLPVLVFDKDAGGGNREIFRVALDGSDVVQLTANAGADVDPAATQGRVYFTSYRTGNADLFRVNLQNNSGGAQLSNTATVNEIAPAVTRDGSRIAYTQDNSGVAKLYRAFLPNFTGGQQVTDPTSHGGTIYGTPTWGPGNNRLAWMTTKSTSADIDSVAFPGDVKTVTSIATASFSEVEPAWSPDGARIAFTSDRDGDIEVYVLNRATSAITRVTNRAGADMQPTWLMDGKLVWVEQTGSATALKWWHPVTLATGTIPVGGGNPKNPSGVPLY